MCLTPPNQRLREALRRRVERGEVIRPARGMYARAPYWNAITRPPANSLHLAYVAEPASHLDVLPRIGRRSIRFAGFVQKTGLGLRRNIASEPQSPIGEHPLAYRRRRRTGHGAGPSRDIAAKNCFRLHANRRFRAGARHRGRRTARKRMFGEFVHLTFQANRRQPHGEGSCHENDALC